MTDVAAELLELSQRLLDAIDQQDWDTYAALCDDELTAYEPEACGQMVRGLPFHRFYFEAHGDGSRRSSSITAPDVRVYGDTALVCYVRLVQRASRDGGNTTSASEETRVWRRLDGHWQHVHFHRSRCGQVEP